eukprot:CAMPEP_0197844520 /NCGR_PEP_ID=MMETSP1438-20131217/1508_1 /TAXON_ID=1461541 /ORGANISM="Pterosperma sp., Strain CCMP1384" /LENGTH=287 /DNA_ID=CAMNT_0043455349 /DNA_START=134 /DNA_END=994 /DNA_ORIENTATION=-
MDVQVSLDGYVQDGAASRPSMNITPGEYAMSGCERVSVEVTIKDARAQQQHHEGLSLDRHGFELVEHSTKLRLDEFYDETGEKVRSLYYKEMEELIKRSTGAEHVHMFHHQVRNINAANGPAGGHSSVQGYANSIHADSHPRSAEHLYLQHVTPQYSKGRFLYINAWRNISDDPIQNNHLAVCDESSLVAPDDYITSDLKGPGYEIQQYQLDSKNSARHRWYYYPEMTKNEVLLFKQWDSDITLPGRVCFHTAFNDPNAPPDTPPRQSIEARGIAFFPHHTPNTCPE